MTLGPSVAALLGLSLPVSEEVHGCGLYYHNVYLLISLADFEGFEDRPATEVVDYRAETTVCISGVCHQTWLLP